MPGGGRAPDRTCVLEHGTGECKVGQVGNLFLFLFVREVNTVNTMFVTLVHHIHDALV